MTVNLDHFESIQKQINDLSFKTRIKEDSLSDEIIAHLRTDWADVRIVDASTDLLNEVQMVFLSGKVLTLLIFTNNKLPEAICIQWDGPQIQICEWNGADYMYRSTGNKSILLSKRVRAIICRPDFSPILAGQINEAL
jgi:hypothetical protein